MSYDRWNARMCNIPEALLPLESKRRLGRQSRTLNSTKQTLLTIWPLESPRKNEFGHFLGLGVLL